jgi:hypothetical protein
MTFEEAVDVYYEHMKTLGYEMVDQPSKALSSAHEDGKGWTLSNVRGELCKVRESTKGKRYVWGSDKAAQS